MPTPRHTYETSHPWIKFELSPYSFGWKTWMLLGEAQSKCEHIAGVPLRPDVADDLHLVYLAKGAHATTAIEGNTLSEDDVRRRVEGELKLPLSKEYLGKEIDNITNAFATIFERCMKGTAILTSESIREYHKMVLDGLPLEVDNDIVPGQFREHPVMVADYRGAPPQDCPHLLERLTDWLTHPAFQGNEENRIAFAILRAIVAHIYIAWIHPFADGNGRTARLIEFQILSMAGIPTPAAHLLSNFYNETRTQYYRELSYASRSGGDLSRFIEYAVQGLVDGLREQLTQIRQYQWTIAWRDYIFRQFDGSKGATDERRRKLALAMPEDKPVDLIHAANLTAELAAAYRDKHDMTVRRDLNALVNMRLIRKVTGGYISNKATIRYFLPDRAIPDV